MGKYKIVITTKVEVKEFEFVGETKSMELWCRKILAENFGPPYGRAFVELLKGNPYSDNRGRIDLLMVVDNVLVEV